MFDSNFVTRPYVSPIPTTYGENLGRATRGFVTALLAMQPSELHEEAASSAEGAEELNQLASQFDEFMPSQAAELRYLAGTAEDTQDA
jgi:hypothetical protein